jgi:AraC-like DNA-binding protein
LGAAIAARRSPIPDRRARRSRPAPQLPGQSVVNPATDIPSLEQRLRYREQFFLDAGIDPREYLQAFDHVPGLFYFIKDAESRTLMNTRECVRWPGKPYDERTVALRPHEYLGSKELAEHYEADDQTVYRTGKPLRNIVEIGFNEDGLPDWIITDKYPLRDATGKIIGLIGTMQTLEHRVQTLPLLGEVGKAASYIREHLGERIHLQEVAKHVGVSERHLQRLFDKHIGMSIQQFIIRSRVHTAAYELIHSQRPIVSIALMCGFSDQSAFTNSFRKLFGIPPREYRALYLKDLAGEPEEDS